MNQETIAQIEDRVLENLQNSEDALAEGKKKSDGYRTQIGRDLIKLRPLIEAEGKGWYAYCRDTFKRGQRDIRKLMKLGDASFEDPEAEAKEKEERNAKDRERRERQKQEEAATRVAADADRIAEATAKKREIQDSPEAVAPCAATVIQRVFNLIDPLAPDEQQALIAMLVEHYAAQPADTPTDEALEPEPKPTHKGKKGRTPGKDQTVAA